MELVFDNVIASQLDYIYSVVDPNGAIRDNEQSNSKITPYFANFAAMALLKNNSEKDIAIVQKYIQWYLKNLNGNKNPYTGETEIPGSIYDYYVGGSSEGKYDSVDSYAATFLMLLFEYAKTSEEAVEWLKEYNNQFSLVASALMDCIDTEDNTVPKYDSNDYLSVASHVYCIKLLMDNCEVNKGLLAAAQLKSKGIINNDVPFDKIAEKNAEAIKSLYNKEGFYAWNKEVKAVDKMDWTKFYPDATAQLYPAMFNVLTSSDSKSKTVYEEFNKNFGSWSTGKTYASHPWAILSYAAAQMGDVDKVNQYITHINSLNIKGDQKPLWYSAEAAFVIFAIDSIHKN